MSDKNYGTQLKLSRSARMQLLRLSADAGPSVAIVRSSRQYGREGVVAEGQDLDNRRLVVLVPAAGKGDSGLHRGLRRDPVVPERAVA